MLRCGKAFLHNVASVSVSNANSEMVNGLKGTSMPGHTLADTSQPKPTEG